MLIKEYMKKKVEKYSSSNILEWMNTYRNKWIITKFMRKKFIRSNTKREIKKQLNE